MKKLLVSLSAVAALSFTACTVEVNSTDDTNTQSATSSDSYSDNGLTPVSSDSYGYDNEDYGYGDDESSSSEYVEVIPCSFQATDNEWSYSLRSSDASYGYSGTVEITYQIDGFNITRIETAKVSGGSTVNLVCGLMGSEHQIKDVNGDGSEMTEQYCEYGEMIRITTTKLTDMDIQELYAFEKQTCEIVNGLADDYTPVIALSTSCSMDPTATEWTYTYYDEDDILTRRTYSIDMEEAEAYGEREEITPMSYAACKMAHPLDETTSYCTDEGYFSRSASGYPVTEPASYYETVISYCTDDTGLPAEDETSTSDSDAEEGTTPEDVVITEY